MKTRHCSFTPRYSTVHRDDFEGKSSQIPKFGDCSIDSGVPATQIIVEWSCWAMENNKTTQLSVLESKSLKHPVSREFVWFCTKTIWLKLWRNLVAARDTRTIKYLYCDTKIVFDRAGEVSGQFQPPSQSQTLSRKKISWIFEANHYFCGDDQPKVGWS